MIHQPTRFETEAISTYLSQQPDVVVAYLFGSIARDQANPLSDVDIAVLLAPGLSAEESTEHQLRLLVALDDLVEREVQVTILNRASPMLAYQVIRHGILLHERDTSERVDFVVRTMKSYFDVIPMLDFHSEALLKRIQEVGLGKRTGRSARTLEAAQRIHDRFNRTAGR